MRLLHIERGSFVHGTWGDTIFDVWAILWEFRCWQSNNKGIDPQICNQDYSWRTICNLCSHTNVTLRSPYLSLCKKFLSFRLLAVPVGGPIRVLLQHDIFIDIFSGIRIACVSSIERQEKGHKEPSRCYSYILHALNTSTARATLTRNYSRLFHLLNLRKKVSTLPLISPAYRHACPSHATRPMTRATFL